jgi:peroxiredoxin
VLEADLAAQRKRASVARSPGERATRARAIDAVASAGVAQRALGVGDPAPRFVLPDATGAEVRLDVLLTSGPVVVCFYRGGWCPYCNIELRSYQVQFDEICRLGATLVAISPELPDRSLFTAERNALRFPVLSDSLNDVARQFRLTHRIDPEVVRYQLGNGNDVAAFNGTDEAEVPLPATYIIKADGIIGFAHVNADYTTRAEPSVVLTRLRQITGRTQATTTPP